MARKAFFLTRVFLFFPLLSLFSKESLHEGNEVVSHKGDLSPLSPLIDKCDNPEALKRWYAKQNEKRSMAGVTVVYRGQIVLQGPKNNERLRVFSVSKSIAALVAALSLNVEDLDKPIIEDYPQIGDAYAGVTYRHLLSMTSGYDAEGGMYKPTEQTPENILDNTHTPHIPASPLFLPPGSQFNYWTDSYRLLGFLIHKKTGKSLRTIYKEKVGIADKDSFGWAFLQTEEYLPEKIEDTGGGVLTSSKELASLGQRLLYAHKSPEGAFISKEWMQEMLTPQVSDKLPLFAYTGKDYDGRGRYGLGWWLNTPAENRPWPALSEKAFAARGVHSNILLVDPENNLVLSRTHTDEDRGGQPDNEWMNDLSKELLEALEACSTKDKSVLDRIKGFFGY